MIFGLFENKQGKLLIKEAARTLDSADGLEEQDKKSIANFLIEKMIKSMKEIEGLAVPSSKLDEILKKQVNEATRMRQGAKSILEDDDPNWLKAAILESFLQANTGHFGKKASRETIFLITHWIRENISEKDYEKLGNKFKFK